MEQGFSGKNARICLAQGDIAGHNAAVADAICQQMKPEPLACAVLAQLSMTIFLLSHSGPLAEFGIPIFTSGQCGLEFVRDPMRRIE